MLGLLDKIPYSILIIAAIFMLLAPFHPMPHVVEKLVILKNGVTITHMRGNLVRLWIVGPKDY